MPRHKDFARCLTSPAISSFSALTSRLASKNTKASATATSRMAELNTAPPWMLALGPRVTAARYERAHCPDELGGTSDAGVRRTDRPSRRPRQHAQAPQRGQDDLHRERQLEHAQHGGDGH